MRKGIHGTYLVMGFILLVVVLLVCSVIFIAWKDVYEKTEQSSRCATQIRVHAAAVQVTGELKAPEVVCPTERFDLDGGQDPAGFIAGEMERCWDMWGRGQLRLFGEGEGLYCHVCSIITIPSQYPVGGLVDELDGKEFFERQGDAELVRPDESIEISTDKPIGVIFYYAKGQEQYDKLYNHIAGQPLYGVVGGVVVGVVVAGLTGGASLLWYGALASVGGVAGFFTSLTTREDIDYLAMTIVRPLSIEDVMQLGCTYAPVAND